MATQSSNIYGKGWGDDHNWARGGTNQVGSAYMFKASYYECRNCGESFAHSYDVYPDIFYQMEVLGISEHCPKADDPVSDLVVKSRADSTDTQESAQVNREDI